MQHIIENLLYALKRHTYPGMRRIATGMTNAYLPPVVARRSIVENPGSSAPIHFNLKATKRFAWHQQVVRHGH